LFLSVSFLKGNHYPLFFLEKLETEKAKLETTYLAKISSRLVHRQDLRQEYVYLVRGQMKEPLI